MTKVEERTREEMCPVNIENGDCHIEEEDFKISARAPRPESAAYWKIIARARPVMRNRHWPRGLPYTSIPGPEGLRDRISDAIENYFAFCSESSFPNFILQFAVKPGRVKCQVKFTSSFLWTNLPSISRLRRLSSFIAHISPDK